MKLYSPAKVNLFLEVVGKRSDGYHDLNTLMQAINLFDVITVEKSAVDYFRCAALPGSDNLVLKALCLFRAKTGILAPISIDLDKKIPIQAGLGGGSGNAATTLFGLNELFGRPASNEELQEWSASIGSDIPFFFSNGTAVCSGRGEIVVNTPRKPRSFWVVKPSSGASTPAVFNAYTKNNTVRHHPFFNDLEQAAEKVVPELTLLREKLLAQGFEIVMMTGSGTAYTCMGGEKEPTCDAAVYKVQTINREIGCWYC